MVGSSQDLQQRQGGWFPMHIVGMSGGERGGHSDLSQSKCRKCLLSNTHCHGYLITVHLCSSASPARGDMCLATHCPRPVEDLACLIHDGTSEVLSGIFR